MFHTNLTVSGERPTAAHADRLPAAWRLAAIWSASATALARVIGHLDAAMIG